MRDWERERSQGIHALLGPLLLAVPLLLWQVIAQAQSGAPQQPLALRSAVERYIADGRAGKHRAVLNQYRDRKWHGWGWWQSKAITEMLEKTDVDPQVLVLREEGDRGVAFFKVKLGGGFKPLSDWEDQVFLFWRRERGKWWVVEADNDSRNPNVEEQANWERFLLRNGNRIPKLEEQEAALAVTLQYVEACKRGDAEGARKLLTHYGYMANEASGWSKEWYEECCLSNGLNDFRPLGECSTQMVRTFKDGRTAPDVYLVASEIKVHELRKGESVNIWLWCVTLKCAKSSGGMGQSLLMLSYEDGTWRVWYELG